MNQSSVATIIYLPRELRYTSYAYLANIYSLMISATISLSQGQLTENDATFVVAAISSPASIGHWLLAFSYISRKLSRSESIDHRKYGFRNSNEFLMMILLSCVSLVAWITFTAIAFTPINRFNFSQPACSRTFALQNYASLLWIVPLLVQTVILIILFVVLVLILRRSPGIMSENKESVLSTSYEKSH